MTAVACYIPIIRDCPLSVRTANGTCERAEDTVDYPWVAQAPPFSWGWTEFYTDGRLWCRYNCPGLPNERWYFVGAFVQGSTCRGQ